MAIKKTTKMSVAPKKVAAKKADPGKGVVTKAKDTMMSMGKTKYKGKPMSDSQSARYWNNEIKDAKYTNKVAKEMVQDTTMSTPYREAGAYSYLKSKKRIAATTDSTKKYTQKSLENIKNLNRKK